MMKISSFYHFLDHDEFSYPRTRPERKNGAKKWTKKIFGHRMMLMVLHEE